MAHVKHDYIPLKSVPRPIRDLVLIKRGQAEENITSGGTKAAEAPQAKKTCGLAKSKI